MAKEPWYKDGLRFECTQCGDCCTGAPGFVWVDPDEIALLAAHFSLSPADFEAKYVRQVGERKSLNEYANGDCVFFDGVARKCSVYPARPNQCRTWPFWDSNLETPADWKWVKSVCPGSRSLEGKLYTLGEIRKRADVVSL